MKNFLIGCLTCVPFSTFAMEAIKDEKAPSVSSDHQNLSEELVKEVAPDVYAGSTKVGNEIVYFGMESVDSKNVYNWISYGEYTDSYTNKNKGLLNLLTLYLEQGDTPLFDKEIKKLTGFTNKIEYENFLDILRQGISNDPKFTALLRGIPTGAIEFCVSDDGNYYVVYASKTPITGKFPFPTEKLPYLYSANRLSFKQYLEIFKDILATVRSCNHKGTDYYENRGTFKSPMTIIFDGKKYPGLSLKLYGFSAAVTRYIFKDKNYMKVRPAPSMRNIILNYKSWKAEDILITVYEKDIEKKDLKSFTTEEFGNLQKICENPYFIKIDALIRIFKGD